MPIFCSPSPRAPQLENSGSASVSSLLTFTSWTKRQPPFGGTFEFGTFCPVWARKTCEKSVNSSIRL